MTIDLLYIFYKVALHKSISEAANDLKVSKSVVSRKLSALEESLELLLLVRTTRSLRLTDEGMELFERIKSNFQGIEETILVTSESKKQMIGNLSISSPVEFSYFLTSTILPEFHELYPDVKLIIEGSFENKDLARDGFDIAVRIGDLDDSSYRYRLITKVSFKLFSSPKFATRFSTINDLKDASWVTSDCAGQNEKTVGTNANYNGKKINLSYENVSHVARGLTIKKNLIATGQGIGFLPEFIFSDSINNGEIVNIFPGLSLKPVNIGFIFPNNKLTPHRVRTFIDFVCEKFTQLDIK